MSPQEENKEESKQNNIRRSVRPVVTESRSFLDTMITNPIYKFSFEREMIERLEFVKFIIMQNP